MDKPVMTQHKGIDVRVGSATFGDGRIDIRLDALPMNGELTLQAPAGERTRTRMIVGQELARRLVRELMDRQQKFTLEPGTDPADDEWIFILPAACLIDDIMVGISRASRKGAA
jgi:hypothetical protein